RGARRAGPRGLSPRLPSSGRPRRALQQAGLRGAPQLRRPRRLPARFPWRRLADLESRFPRRGQMRISKVAVAAALALASSLASAQTIKIGFITSYSGLNGNLGPYMERAVRLYLKQHEKELGGVKVELITRDDTGPNPDKAKQLAQELIVRDKVNLLAGVIFTPNAMAMAPLCTEAKVPLVIMNAGTSVITTRSPYLARVSFTLWQSSYPLGQWAAKKFKRAYTLV